MITHIIEPRIDPAARQDDERRFVVCSRLPYYFTSLEWAYAEFIGGQLFTELVRLRLRLANVEMVDQKSDVESCSLFQAFVLLTVRDVFAAARAVQPFHNDHRIAKYFFAGYLDNRNGQWIALGAHRPDFDFDQYVMWLLKEAPKRMTAQAEQIQRDTAEILKKNSPPPAPPSAPAP